MTVECPDEIKVPLGALDLYKSGNYWILSASTVHHQGREKKVEFNVEELKVGDTVGCSIHEDGTLHYYVNGKDRGISWNDKLPTNQAMYGFADVYGAVRKIRSLFHYGMYVRMYVCMCMLSHDPSLAHMTFLSLCARVAIMRSLCTHTHYVIINYSLQHY